MSKALDQHQYKDILNLAADKRLKYLLKTVTQQQEIWILIDDIGCVMLNSDEEDCVPVWPNKEFAEAWATGEWQHCHAEKLTLDKWFDRWTPGLLEDELSVAIFPNQSEEGIILFADEFADELHQQQKSS